MKTLGRILNPLRFTRTKVPLETPITGIARDAQKVRPGEVFFAIRGAKIDSHLFIEEAMRNGAAAIVVESHEAYEKFDQTILVDSTRSQLAESASAWFNQPTHHLKLVGVTGTNGKTTCSYLLREIWEELGIKSGMIGTVETCIGKNCRPSQLTTPGPLELQGMFFEMNQELVTHAIMEVSSIALDQNRVGGCEFQAAIFTNFSQDHLDYHGTFENYFQSKLKLFTDFGLPLGVVNLDDEWAKRILIEGKAKRWLTFSLKDPSADFFADLVECSVGGTQAKLKTPQGFFSFSSTLIGSHNLYNALGVLAAFYGLGGNLEQGIKILNSARGAPGRLERVMEGDHYPSIFVDYAHSDDALRNVLETLLKLKKKRGKIITVFGCGGDRDKTKRPKMASVVSSLSDLTIVTSDNPRTEKPETILEDIEKGLLPNCRYHKEVQRKPAIEWALSQAKPEDLVLIAGKGHEMYQIIGTTQFPFDDRIVVRDYYRNVQSDNTSGSRSVDER
ncbi:MAG: UDP-N-acetylmuramoyl-L-alanyl-D-glutamate--2,6-diaminopimelate ligase [Pseudomonadota bacterium]